MKQWRRIQGTIDQWNCDEDQVDQMPEIIDLKPFDDTHNSVSETQRSANELVFLVLVGKLSIAHEVLNHRRF